MRPTVMTSTPPKLSAWMSPTPAVPGLGTMAGLRRPLDPFELTLTVDYRVRKANGQYIKVLRQTAVFDVDEESGKVISTFSLCKDISTIKSSNRIGWQVRGLRSGEVDLRVLVDQLPKLQYRPSEREIALRPGAYQMVPVATFVE